MADLSMVLDRLSPDILRTLRRFPFAIALLALGTAVLLLAINDVLPDDQEETWFRLVMGVWTGAMVATAGAIFAESRPNSGLFGRVLTYLLPLVWISLYQVKSTDWVLPVVLTPVAALWLSVAGFTIVGSGEGREDAQNRFWWLNHRAVSAGIIASIAFLLILAGVVAVERSLAMLFGVEAEQLFYRGVMPLVGGLLVPVYWLSTLPELNEYAPEELEAPDFLSRAVGFLGQFILTPLLGIYSLILLAYAAQIALSQSLPQGTLGWMVLAYSVTGAANWLVLHPRFMREKPLARLFRRLWFWALLLPLVLFGIGVAVRIDAYGLTPERVLLVAGGVWSASLAAVFLVPRLGDIRLIPALAGLLLAIVGIGPWNAENISRWDQERRLDGAVAASRAGDGAPEWSEPTAAQAESALEYLYYSEGGLEAVRRVAARHGVAVGIEVGSYREVADAFGVPEPQFSPDMAGGQVWLNRGVVRAVDVVATPYLLGDVSMGDWGDYATHFGLELAIRANHLVVRLPGQPASEEEVDLAGWIGLQILPSSVQRPDAAGLIVSPAFDFALGERRFRLVVESAALAVTGAEPDVVLNAKSFNGLLFSSAAE